MHDEKDHPSYEFYVCNHCGVVASVYAALECDCHETCAEEVEYMCIDFYTGYCPVCKEVKPMSPVVGLVWG